MATANHVLLRRITLTTSASSVTFDSIPQTGYTDLNLVISARDSYAAAVVNLTTKFNGSTSGYSEKLLYGNGASASSATQATSSITFNYMPGSTATGSTFGNTNIYIPNYSGSSHKFISSESITENNATTVLTGMTAGLWANSPAITSIELGTLGTAFIAGSSFALYGIADAATTPTAAPKADGGDIIKTDGTYWYHAFLSSGLFKPQVNLTADLLVVAGGGGGAYDGAGGGAGGVLGFASQSLSIQNYNCTIGAGGTGGLTLGSPLGTNGVDSQFAALTLVKGGGYGGSSEQAPTNFPPNIGGSGGGGARYNTSAQTGAAGTSGQGSAGGNGVFSAPQYGAGGGGGKGGIGGNGTSTAGGSGGAGTNSVTNWGALSSALTATGLGVSGYLAGGGGGGTYVAGTQGVGGSGGGGNGSTSATAGTAGTASSGGGGGGGAGSTNLVGRSGGSGIVIIRYPV